MQDFSQFLPGLSPVAGKPVHVAFDGGRLTSDAGILVLAEIERRLGIAERLAQCLADPRDPDRIRHSFAEMIRFRALMIAAGYARPQAMDWLERNRVGYVFGLATNPVLRARTAELAEAAALARLDDKAEKVRRFAGFAYAARSWKLARRIVARIEASAQGGDSRFIVTNLAGTPQALYEKLYCARGQMENLIKAHKLHLASDRTACSKATANQFRRLIHTAAYWLIHTLRGLAPKTSFWRDAQFDTIRLALIKVAGRVTEPVTRIKLSLPSTFAYRETLTMLAARAAKLPP